MVHRHTILVVQIGLLFYILDGCIECLGSKSERKHIALGDLVHCDFI